MVIWLCWSCHKKVHTALPPLPRQQKSREQEAFDDACTSAYHRIVEETGKSRTRIAADMGMSESSLIKYLSDGWSLGGVQALACASKQNVVRMLAREAFP